MTEYSACPAKCVQIHSQGCFVDNNNILFVKCVKLCFLSSLLYLLSVLHPPPSVPPLLISLAEVFVFSLQLHFQKMRANMNETAEVRSSESLLLHSNLYLFSSSGSATNQESFGTVKWLYLNLNSYKLEWWSSLTEPWTSCCLIHFGCHLSCPAQNIDGR